MNFIKKNHEIFEDWTEKWSGKKIWGEETFFVFNEKTSRLQERNGNSPKFVVACMFLHDKGKKSRDTVRFQVFLNNQNNHEVETP